MLGGHEYLQLSPHWYLALTDGEMLIVKLVAEYDKYESTVCALNSNMQYVRFAIIRHRKKHNCPCCLSCTSLYNHCSLQLVAISMSTPSAWELTYCCDYIFTMLCAKIFSPELYNLFIKAAHCRSQRDETLVANVHHISELMTSKIWNLVSIVAI